ncbi:MAG TPA: hypothetical protein VML00_02525 [Bacteroidota bacterium]|nr:hypothetical protein [Bacteroidota bacterium]
MNQFVSSVVIFPVGIKGLLLANPVERKYIFHAPPVLSQHAGYSRSGVWRLRSYPPKSNVIPMGLHSAVRVPLAAFAISGILALTASAQPDRERDLEAIIRSHVVWDPADFILQKLATHRVVMIGDAGHGDPLYYRLVVASLNRWVSAFEGKQQNDVPRGLPRRLAVLTGFKVWFHSGASPQERADSLWACIVKYRKPLVVENLIHLLWIGSEAEKRSAVAVLREETGERYSTAGEWTEWWESRP